MSHGQPNRPQAEKLPQTQPIKYGDVFMVSGEQASKSISPEDEADMQATETRVLGQTDTPSPAQTTQTAAAIKQAAGAVSNDEITDIAKNQGVSVTETKAGGQRTVTEAVAGQVLGQRVEPDEPRVATGYGSAAIDGDPITIGEALEAVGVACGDKLVDQSDAAAITAAEIRASGRNEKTPTGLGATAQAAATLNTHALRREDMTKLSDVLADATERLEKDKVVTSEDAEAVYAAEVQFPWRRDTPETVVNPGGVAASMATAARLNQER